MDSLDTSDKVVFGTIVRAKCAVIGHVLGAQLRVSEESFRQERFNRLPELIAIIKEEKNKLPARIIEEAISQSVP